MKDDVYSVNSSILKENIEMKTKLEELEGELLKWRCDDVDVIRMKEEMKEWKVSKV